MDIPFDVSYHFDDNLHDVPNSPAQMRQAISFLQSKLDSNREDLPQQISLLGLIGGYARMLHDFSTAATALNSALNLCHRLKDERLKIANLIRLAHLYQWQKQYDRSEALLDKVLIECKNNPLLELYCNFAYQHLGKCKFDQAKYKQAQHCFGKALKLRQIKGDRSLIDSTQLALNVTQQRIGR